MTKQQIIERLIASDNFQFRNYARQYGLTGHDPKQLLDEVITHLESQEYDFLSSMYEVCCPNEAMSRYDELREYDDYEESAFSHLDYT